MQGNPLVRYLKNQSFQPDIVSLLINPFYFIRSALFNGIKEYSARLSGKLLDYGCGRKPYRNLFNVSEYIGVDIEQSGHDHSLSEVDIYFDGKQLPFSDHHFDSLFCSEVLEHIFEPDEALNEMHRVLKPGATALFTVPFCWNEHEVPYDYARYSSFGVKHLIEKNGFKIIEMKKAGSFARVNFQLWSLYFFELFRPWGRFGHVISLLFIFPINLIGSILLIFLPRRDSLYFNNIILAQRL